MFWSKKKIEEPQPSERETQIVGYAVKSMEEHPDYWLAKGNYSGKGTFTREETVISPAGARTLNKTTVELTYRSAKLTFNSAQVDLTEVSIRKLIRAGEGLLKEKLLRSLIRADELDENRPQKTS
jgi:hypothetical protein